MKYDRNEEYLAHIEELATQIRRLCATYKIPFIMSFVVSNDDDKKVTTYKTAVLDPIVLDEELAYNYLPQALLALRGGRFVPPTPSMVITDKPEVNEESDDDDEEVITPDIDLNTVEDSFGGTVIEDL